GYMDSAGKVHQERQSADDKPVYAIELKPEDGVYPLPYMALQADGKPWDEECAYPFAPEEKARQGFFPDGSRSFEEIDRLQIGPKAIGNWMGDVAEFDFYRVMPPGGFKKGLPAALRKDVGEGDIAPEGRGEGFFPYKPHHLAATPTRRSLARATNAVQTILA